MGKVREVMRSVTVASNFDRSQIPNSEIYQERLIGELERRLIPEAIEAINETKKAIAAVARDDKPLALKSLQRAVEQLNTILACDLDLALLPTDYAIEVVDTGLENEKIIREIRRDIRLAIKFGYLAEARRLIDSLASEIRVTVTDLPLAGYLDALQRAIAAIARDRNKLAQRILKSALATLVLEEEYLPIPILKARSLIESARVQNDRQIAMQLLTDARKQLRLSHELGYGEADLEYDELRSKLIDLEKQLQAREHDHHNFRELKTKIASFLQRASKAESH